MSGSVTTEIARIDHLFDGLLLTNERFIGEVENSMSQELQSLQEREEYRIASTLPALTSLTMSLYLETETRVVRIYFSPNPGFFAFLVAVWGVIVTVYQSIKVVIDFLHIAELLAIADILAVIWPQFRAGMDRIYGKVAALSEQIGFGADGLMHLIQATQGGIGMVGSMLGKDKDWVEIKLATKAKTTLSWVSNFSETLAADPGKFLNMVFMDAEQDTRRELTDWWSNTLGNITNAVTKAEDAFTQAKDVLSEFQEAQNKLPWFISKHIPVRIWDSINWTYAKITKNLLPNIDLLKKNISEVNAVMDAQREMVTGLLDELKHPGDIKARLEALTGASRAVNEANLDSAAGSLFAKQTDGYEEYDKEIMTRLESVTEALSAPIPEPSFLALEGAVRNEIPRPPGSGIETWFLPGDY